MGLIGKISKEKALYHIPVLVCIAAIVLLILIPTGFEDAVIYKETVRCAARVLDVNNERIIDSGLIRTGEQTCTVEFLEGDFKGRTAEGVNMLSGSMEQDKIFAEGDKAMVLIHHNGDEILSVSMIDHYRLRLELILAAAFVLFLILVAGKTGIRAVLSFILTILMLWKVLVPLYLKGFDPVFAGICITLLLTALILALVYGFDRKWAAAFIGSGTGVMVTCVLGILFTYLFKIHGAIMPNSESLLYAGYQHLNLTRIFMASIFIGASGAVMDLAVDITSAVNEVVEKKPDISVKEAIRSGMNVGRATMGTMTTTLLLAYSGGYIALLMVFMAQGTPIYNILNYKYVAAEIADTIVGSFGLVSVAPLTALASGVLLAGKKVPPALPEEPAETLPVQEEIPAQEIHS